MAATSSPVSGDDSADQWQIDVVAVVTSFTTLTLLRCATGAILDCIRERRRRRDRRGNSTMTSSSYGSTDVTSRKRQQPICADCSVTTATGGQQGRGQSHREGQLEDNSHLENRRTREVSADIVYGIFAAAASAYILTCIRLGDQRPFLPASSSPSPPHATQQLLIHLSFACAIGRCLYELALLVQRPSKASASLSCEADIALLLITLQMLGLALITSENIMLATLALLYQVTVLFKALHTLVTSSRRLYCLIPVCSALWMTVTVSHGLVLPACFLVAGILTESPLLMSGLSQTVLFFTVTVFALANLVTVWRIHCYLGTSSHRVIFNLHVFFRRPRPTSSSLERQDLLTEA